MSEWKTVTKQEFEEFIANYDGTLSSSISAICEPPLASFRDESIGTQGEIGSADYFFDKQVARIYMSWLSPCGKKVNTDKYYKYQLKIMG